MRKLLCPKRDNNHTYSIAKLLPFHSLQLSMLLSFIIIIILLTSIILYYYLGIVKHANEQAKENFEQMAVTYHQKLEETMSSALSAAQGLAYNESCQKFLLSDDPSAVITSRQSAIDAISYITTFGEGFRDIVILSNKNRKISETNQYTEVVEAAIKEFNIDSSLRLEEEVYSQPITYQDRQYISCLFPVYGAIDGYRYRDNTMLGSVIYLVDDLLSQIEIQSYPQTSAILMDGNHIIISSKNINYDPHMVVDTGTQTSYMLSLDSIDYYVYNSYLTINGWRIVYVIPWEDLGTSMDRTNHFFNLLVMALALLIALIMTLILLSVQHNIKGLTKDISLLGLEKNYVETPNLNELQIVSSTLNQTLMNLQDEYYKEQELINANYKAMLAQIHAEMLAYRSQINPHYLFNTLEAARSFAHHYKSFEVEKLIGHMAKMFKYSLYSPMLVPLTKELENLDSYLAVIETRFPHRYSVKKSIPEETLSWMLLSVILQPLIENVLQHAFIGRKNGKLLIKAELRDNRLIIIVADNGIGMSPEHLNEIKWKITHSSEHTATLDMSYTDSLMSSSNFHDISIGLTNIYRRLKLTFDTHADLILESKEGFYTVAKLIIPPIDQSKVLNKATM